MLREEIDIAVHSMKDVPTFFPEGIGLRCITEREDPRDIVVLKQGMQDFNDIPQGARIGTSACGERPNCCTCVPTSRCSTSAETCRPGSAN